MIIFDLDGTLADCEHRRRFVDPSKNPDYLKNKAGDFQDREEWIHYIDKTSFKPDWKAFYEACDKDKLIWPVKSMFMQNVHRDVKIWSGRCESVRKKTIVWLEEHTEIPKGFLDLLLKMRPIGDDTPEDQLKEKWLNEYLYGKSPQMQALPQMVFDSNPKSIEMWRRRGIFVFDCNQTEERFL